MAEPKGEAPEKHEEPKQVLVECTINNIWTSQGKLVRGGAIMLDADEAKFIKAKMKATNKAKLEA